MFAVCIVPVAPIRLTPDHAAEMTSQLVFGEYCEVLELAANGFYRITCVHDGYEGFCMGNQLSLDVTPEAQPAPFFADWSNTIYDEAGQPMVLPFGARWPKAMEGSFAIGGSRLQPATSILTAEKLRDIASLYVNTPYLWGGRTVFGADCSGFVQMVMRIFGYTLPRDASQQFAVCRSQGGNPSFGDLAFFEADGRIVHVGILLGRDRIIHAFGKLRIDKLDDTGIWNPEMLDYSHKLAGVKSLP